MASSSDVKGIKNARNRLHSHADKGVTMTSSLLHGVILDDLAQHLYDFLPAQPHPFADSAISFPGVAQELGLDRCWSGGSKRPAIRKMLEEVLTRHGSQFTRLLVKIVERSITYRRNKTPVSREDIEGLNALVAKLGFKAPELCDLTFLGSLPRKTARAAESAATKSVSAETTKSLRDKLIVLNTMTPQKRGFAFEGFLNELFEVFGLAPRDSFRLVGEQIDGSFQLGQDVYLVEAKWQADKTGETDLLSFSGKVDGKARWARGLFIGYAGFSDQGLEAFARGKRTSIVCMDGFDLCCVLDGKLDLPVVIERKVRRAGETNNAFVSVRDLFPSTPF